MWEKNDSCSLKMKSTASLFLQNCNKLVRMCMPGCVQLCSGVATGRGESHSILRRERIPGLQVQPGFSRKYKRGRSKFRTDSPSWSLLRGLWSSEPLQANNLFLSYGLMRRSRHSTKTPSVMTANTNIYGKLQFMGTKIIKRKKKFTLNAPKKIDFLKEFITHFLYPLENK